MATTASPYLRHRFPPEIIAQCVLLYMRFPLSFRAVEEAMLLRGVQVSYKTICTLLLHHHPCCIPASSPSRRQPQHRNN